MNPERCDEEVYKKGTTVFITNTIPTAKLNQWVESVAEESGQKVDWHSVGGRSVVRALGDLNKVRYAILKLLPEHNRLQKEEHDRLCPHLPYIPSCFVP